MNTVGINQYLRKRKRSMIRSKSKLNSREVLISKALIDSNISLDKFVLINNVLKEYDITKKEIKI